MFPIITLMLFVEICHQHYSHPVLKVFCSLYLVVWRVTLNTFFLVLLFLLLLGDVLLYVEVVSMPGVKHFISLYLQVCFSPVLVLPKLVRGAVFVAPDVLQVSRSCL